MKPALSLLVLIASFALYVLATASLYTVSETEQVIITQFGKPVGDAVSDAGLHVKVPFIQKVNRFEKRIIEWDGPPANMPTRDKVYIVVDNFARWRITDPRKFFVNLRDERGAQSRLTDILGSETRNVIAKHDFIEAVRTTKDRKVARDANIGTSIADARIGNLPPIIKGRSELEKEIFANAAPKMEGFGIELMDLRFKRINYNVSVSQTIYQRMVSERTQIAERFKSEGAGEAAKILGQRERDLKLIESEAYRKVQEIEGAADAKATEIYANAYNGSVQAREFFEFTKTMEAYKKVLTADTNLILSTDSDFLHYLKSDEKKAVMPSVSSGDPVEGLPSLLDLARPTE
ncbi:membrane protease subunit HflC [Prosthecobacter fusiformis]|uniref:Protein HflC n=1 Tax=Prosthecobacter fusiformis TaxID=48464 RepID=A0A4V3FG41_9BACT|nr:protease modulator HflC [Prosthecobacter fusiformis]TDU73103.1 membrane protease subunit HflC [Prosthecobacter fusiformis]